MRARSSAKLVENFSTAKNGEILVDAAGNLAGPQTTGPYLLECAIVDGFPPSATTDVIVPTNGIYQAGQQLTVTMEFTEPVVFRGSATNAVTFQIGAFRPDAAARGTAAAPVRTVDALVDPAAIRQKPEAPFQEAKQAVELSQAVRIVVVGRADEIEGNES